MIPDALEAALASLPRAPVRTTRVQLSAARRQARPAGDGLGRNEPRRAHTRATRSRWPQGAPFGAVVVDATACTLCQACTGVCPTGALIDNPETPMLRFTESACVQCGLCAATCPEDAITLEPAARFRGLGGSPPDPARGTALLLHDLRQALRHEVGHRTHPGTAGRALDVLGRGWRETPEGARDVRGLPRRGGRQSGLRSRMTRPRGGFGPSMTTRVQARTKS